MDRRADIGLPDGTGWDLLKLAQSSRPIFAIAMSGYGMNADRVRTKEAGFRQHILKPFVPEELDRFLEMAADEIVAARSQP